MDYKINDVFQRTGCQPDTKLTGIETHSKGKDGKAVKLVNPIYSFEYIGIDKPLITMYKTDLDKLIHLERWKLI